MTEFSKNAVNSGEKLTENEKKASFEKRSADPQGLDDSSLEAISGGLLEEYADVTLLESSEEDKRIKKGGC